MNTDWLMGWWISSTYLFIFGLGNALKGPSGEVPRTRSAQTASWFLPHPTGCGFHRAAPPSCKERPDPIPLESARDAGIDAKPVAMDYIMLYWSSYLLLRTGGWTGAVASAGRRRLQHLGGGRMILNWEITRIPPKVYHRMHLADSFRGFCTDTAMDQIGLNSWK